LPSILTIPTNLSPPYNHRPQKVRAYLASNPESGKTLESLLAAEKAAHKNAKDRKTTEGLMWLLRGLKFTARGLRHNVDNPSAELSTSFTQGYEESLKKHHGMMVRPVFYVSREAILFPRCCTIPCGPQSATLRLMCSSP